MQNFSRECHNICQLNGCHNDRSHVYKIDVLLMNANYLKAIVGPTTKFHITMLIIKWKPRDVYFTRTFKNSWGNIQTCAIISDHNICLKRPIEFFISTVG